MGIIKSLTAVAVAVAVAAAAAVALAPAASASVPARDWERTVFTSDTGTPPAGTMDWTPYGEWMRLCDRQPDGYRAVVRYYTSDDYTTREFQNANGSGTCRENNLSISESGWVSVNVCLRDGTDGALRSCSGWVRLPAQG